jgi:hypothetical protein
MASKRKKDMTAADILAFLRGGGSAEDLMGSSGFTQEQLLGVLLSDPEGLSPFLRESQRAAEPYESFMEDFQYDQDDLGNEVIMKYQQYPEKYQTLAKDFFGRVKRTGNNPVDMADYIALVSDDPELQQQFGLTSEEVYALLPELQTDASKYMDAEVSRQKKQFAAFQKQRNDLGVDKEGSAYKAYIKQLTGTAEVADLPTDTLGLAQKRVGTQAKEYGQQRGKAEGLSPLQSRQLENIYLTEYSKKSRAKGINPLKAGAVDLLKTLATKKKGNK